MHCTKIHEHNSIMHCKALNQDLKIQQSTEFTYAGVAHPCSSCVPSDDPYFTLNTYPTNCNCTTFCFPYLILLSMKAAPSYTSPFNILPQWIHDFFFTAIDITHSHSVILIYMETTADKIRFFKTRNV